MSHDAWVYLNTAGLQMPKDPENKVSRLAVFRVLSNLVCHAREPDLLCWVGSRKQELECDMARSSVFFARWLLEKHGWLVRTGVVHQAGALEYKVILPGYEPSSGITKQTTNELPSGVSSGVSGGVFSGIRSGVSSNAKTEQNMNTTQAQALFELVVKRQLEHETWRTYTDPEAFKKKHAAEYLPVCETALRHFPGGHNDPDVVHWVLGDLFAKTNPNYKVAPSLLQILANRYGLPGGNLVSKEPDFDPEQSVQMAQRVREQFRQQCEQNRQK